MKSLLVFISYMYTSAFLWSQPIVDSTWFATCHTLTETLYLAHRASQPQELQALVGAAGADVVWDFSDLQTIRFDCELNYLERDVEKYTSELPYHNWLNIRNGENELQLHLTQASLEIVGYRFAEQYQFYDDPLRITNFPLTYFSNFQDTAIYFYDGDRKRSTTYRNFLCDGYGTLMLPQDTFQNVLRVKIEDETYHHAMPSAQLINRMRQTTYYFWTTDVFAEPLTILIQEFVKKGKPAHTLTILYNPYLKSLPPIEMIDDSSSALFELPELWMEPHTSDVYASHHK